MLDQHAKSLSSDITFEFYKCHNHQKDATACSLRCASAKNAVSVTNSDNRDLC